jgi:catechol 1,2-dioxygenase
MSSSTRRDFIRQGSLGLATLTASGLVLRASAQLTPASGQLGSYGRYLLAEQQVAQLQNQQDQPDVKNLLRNTQRVQVQAPGKLVLTEDNILGPFYRVGAPFRGKVTPPLEPGTTLLVSGRVWGIDTRQPLAGAVIDIWQANAKGRYDNDDPAKQPAKDVFVNRARLVTDETGYYEFETIHPGAYQIDKNVWRPAHIHYLVRAQGYKSLVTQLYFKGDPHNKTDEFIRDSLIIEVRPVKSANGNYETGVFDIVLAPGDANKR